MLLIAITFLVSFVIGFALCEVFSRIYHRLIFLGVSKLAARITIAVMATITLLSSAAGIFTGQLLSN